MDHVHMFVNGQAMSGGSLHDALNEAELVGPVLTAPRYRFFAFGEEFPGLYPVTEDGRAVPGELYRVEYRVLREKLLPREPAELELTLIELADGSGSLSMRVREGAQHGEHVTDISDAGGWLAWLDTRPVTA